MWMNAGRRYCRNDGESTDGLNHSTSIQFKPRVYHFGNMNWGTYSQGLAGTCLRDTDHVATRQCHRPSLSLDRGWCFISSFDKLLHQKVGQVGLFESDDRFRNVSAMQRYLVLVSVTLNIGRGPEKKSRTMFLQRFSLLLSRPHRTSNWKSEEY